MDAQNLKILGLAKDLNNEFIKLPKPPDEGFHAKNDHIIPLSIVKGTRGYIEKVANQINGCYENGWYDACAVMIRRLLETILIETFESKNLDNKIKNINGDFFPLEEIINKTLSETAWNLNRDVKKALPTLKQIGDLSAHSRRYNAHYRDIEKIAISLRITIQEFTCIAFPNK